MQRCIISETQPRQALLEWKALKDQQPHEDPQPIGEYDDHTVQRKFNRFASMCWNDSAIFTYGHGEPQFVIIIIMY